MPTSRLQLPSYASGFARNAAESEFPEDWRGLLGMWTPALGATGLVLRDWSGHQNHGVVSGATWAATRMGAALEFDGSSSYVQLAKDVVIPYTAATICFLMRFDSLARVADRMLANSGTSSQSYVQLGGNDNRWQYESDTPNNVVIIAVEPATTGWYHVVFQILAGDVQYYEDGVYIATGNVAFTDDITVDQLSWNDADYSIDGQVALIQIYNYAVSPVGIAARAADPLRMLRRRSAPIWRFPATIGYVDPDGDSGTNNWVMIPVNGGHYTNIDDATRQPTVPANDRIYTGTDTAVEEFTCTNITVGAISSVTIWAYCEFEGGAGARDILVDIDMGGWQGNQSLTPTDALAWKSTEFTGTWDQDDLTGLDIRLTASLPAGGEVIVHALYAELAYTESTARGWWYYDMIGRY